MCKEIYVENGMVIGCDLGMDYNDPSYHLAMDYLEGRVKPNYPVPCKQTAIDLACGFLIEYEDIFPYGTRHYRGYVTKIVKL